MNITGSKLDMTFAPKSDVEMVEQQKQEFKLLGTYLRTKGMNLYCYNPHKDSVELVEFKKSKNCILVINGNDFHVEDYDNPSIEVDPTWEYFEKSNMKNALAHVSKFKQGKIKYIWNLKLPNDPKKMSL